jgi:hypothetical protein
MRLKGLPGMLAMLILTAVCQPTLSAQTKKDDPKSGDVDYSVGLNAAYNRAAVKTGADDTANVLEYTYLALQIDVGLLDFLTIGVVAGYNSNVFKDPLNFYRLPLTLNAEGERFNSMMFGLRAKSDLFSVHDYSLAVSADWLYFKRFNLERPITLPIASGTAILKHSFHQLTLELLVQYDGLSGMTVCVGPQVNLIRGKMTATEIIENLEGENILKYDQKKTVGMAAGVYYELGGHFDLKAKLSLFSKTALSVTLFYVF